MSKNVTPKAKDYDGLFIYHDDKNCIYCAPFSKTGYILSNKEVGPFRVYSSRYYLPISIGVLAFLITQSILIALISAIVLFILMEIMFRKNVLANCVIIENFTKPKTNTIFDKVSKKFTKADLMIPLILLIVLAIAIPINANSAGYSQDVIIINYVLSGFVGALAIFVLICILKIKK